MTRWKRDSLPTPVFMGFSDGSDGKESICNAGDLGSIPGLGRSSKNHHQIAEMDYLMVKRKEPPDLLAPKDCSSSNNEGTVHELMTSPECYSLTWPLKKLCLNPSGVWGFGEHESSVLPAQPCNKTFSASNSNVSIFWSHSASGTQTCIRQQTQLSK